MPDFGDLDPLTGQPSARTNYAGTVDPNAPSVANGQISPEQWAAYQKKRKRDAILGVLMTLGGTTAASAASSLIGGGAAAGSAGAGGLPPIAGGAPWAITPYASAAGMSAPGAIGAAGAAGAAGAGAAGAGGGAAAGGGGIAGGLLSGMSAADWAALAAAGIGTAGAAMTDRPETNPNTSSIDPALSNLINTQTRRMNQQQPLYDSILQLAMGLMPTNVQRPLNGGGGGL